MAHVWATFWPAFVIALAGMLAVGMWRGGRAFLAALVEIARLPNLVESLLDEIRGLVHRVSALEALVPDELRGRVAVDLTVGPKP